MPLRRDVATKIFRQRNRARSVGVLPLLILMTSLGACPDSSLREAQDWKAALAFADAAWERGDRIEAKSAYLRAARIASWRDDWKGILAAACGMERIESMRGFYFNTRSILVLAMIGAEKNRSGAGLRAVADAFIAIAELEAAAMALSKIEPSWRQSDDDSYADSGGWNCWAGE